MSEGEFWTQYVKSSYFLRTKGEMGANGNDLIQPYIDEDADDYEIHPKRVNLGTQDRLVDLNTTAEDHLEQTEITDLKQAEDGAQVPLVISDPTRYFEAQASVESSAELRPNDRDAQYFRSSVQKWKPDLPKMKVDKSRSDRILSSLNEASRKRKLDNRSMQDGRPLEGKDEVLQVHALITELLRRFWVAKTKTSRSAQRRDECQQIVRDLESHMRKAAANDKLLGPLRESTEAALKIYEKERRH
ncbi:hypothetical protein HDV00_007880 [Rhizophlyctis rosea]|nr:hypothetical protein HDV00_007880 [Rhizophlyctis rosea]